MSFVCRRVWEMRSVRGSSRFAHGRQPLSGLWAEQPLPEELVEVAVLPCGAVIGDAVTLCEPGVAVAGFEAPAEVEEVDVEGLLATLPSLPLL